MISGYRNLQVNIYVTANSAKMYYEINYTAKANSVIVPDDVYTMVRKWLPKGFITNKEDFMKEIQQQKPNQMFGSVLDEVKLYHGNVKHLFIFHPVSQQSSNFTCLKYLCYR